MPDYDSAHPLTLTVPNATFRDQLHADLSDDERARVRVGVWDMTDAPDVPAEDVELVVTPGYAAGLADAVGRVPNLRYVQLPMIGYEHVLPLVPDGVVVCNGAGLVEGATAEFAVGLILAVQRKIDDFARAMPSGQWLQHRGRSLTDSRVLIVGAGHIASAIADRLAPFEVTLTRVGTHARDDDRGHVHANTELPELLPHADIVVAVVPSTPETDGMANAAFFAAMPDDALFVNVGRGAFVDQDALLAELTAGRLRAALDVTTPEPLPADDPLWRAPNLLIAPHVAGFTTALFPRLRRLIARQVRHLLAGEAPDNVVSDQT